VSIRVRAVPFGRPAALALREEIGRAQGGDPLTPVTVVVARGHVGLAMRRLLSSARLGPPATGRGAGLLNVRFVTLSRLAHELGGPALDAAGHRPLTDAVLTAAAMEVVRARPGPVGSSATLPAPAARALCSTWRDLRGVPAVARRRLAAQGPGAATVVDLLEALTDRLRDWYDDADCAAEAARQVARRPAALGGTGSVIWYLPAAPPPWATGLVRALAGSTAVTLLVGRTGEPAADEPAHRLCAALGVPLDDDLPPAAASAPRPVVEVVSAPSADAEILVAARGVLERLEAGVPAERIALVDAGSPAYRRQIREVLTIAGVPFHGNAVRTLAATVPGRTLLGLFEIDDGGWRRDDVVGWFSAAPLRDAEGVIAASRWDLVTRRAGVTGGLDGWRARLADHAAGQQGRLDDALAAAESGREDDAPEAAAARVDRLRRDVAQTARLRRFVDHVASLLAEGPRTWEGWSRWCLGTLDDLLGGPAGHGSWPEVDVLARDAVREAVVALAALDRLAEPPGSARVDLATFRAALAAELDAPAPDVSRTGRGVMTGHVDELVGLEMDAVFMVGLVDGRYPSAGRDDPLLPDRARSQAGDELPLRTRRQAEARRRHLAVLAGAQEAVLSYARGDQQQGREQRPARWLLDEMGANLPGAPRVYARDLQFLEPFAGYRVVESFTAAVAAPGVPLSLADADLRSVTAWGAAGRRVRAHALAAEDAAFARGLELQTGRRSRRFTRFDGLVADDRGFGSPTDRTQSPTGLERYGSCPRRYFLERVLGVRIDERPEQVVRIEPGARGSVVHRILERFVSATLIDADEAPRAAGAPYTEADHAVLEQVTQEELAEAERKGLTGWPVLWQLDRASILRDLARFPAADEELRRELGSAPAAVEQRFDGVAVPVGQGAAVSFRGTIDRVDRTADGGAVVIDYKTGAAYGLGEIEEDAAHGRRLQLPIYALAASAGRPPESGSPVRSLYWYVSEKGGFARAALDFDAAAYGRLSTVVGSMVDGIAAGVFPANPGPRVNGDGTGSTYKNCRFCPFDSLCGRERASEWSRKQADPAMAPYTRWAVA
jgi:RecB family exonuclease